MYHTCTRFFSDLPAREPVQRELVHQKCAIRYVTQLRSTWCCMCTSGTRRGWRGICSICDVHQCSTIAATTSLNYRSLLAGQFSNSPHPPPLKIYYLTPPSPLFFQHYLPSCQTKSVFKSQLGRVGTAGPSRTHAHSAHVLRTNQPVMGGPAKEDWRCDGADLPSFEDEVSLWCSGVTFMKQICGPLVRTLTRWSCQQLDCMCAVGM